jgi:RimJ/RimL family protein N-acetyltransferase
VDAIRIVPTTTEAHIAGFNRCVDVVARERRYIGLVTGPPLTTSAAFVRHVLGGGGVHLVALDPDDTVVGWCDITRHEREGFRHTGRLGMGLLPSARGHGLGRRLASAAIEAARTTDFERIELDVFASNTRAIALYERLGFVHEGVRRCAWKLDGAYEDDLLMALFLPPHGATGATGAA